MPYGQKSLANVHMGSGAAMRTRNDWVHATSLDILSSYRTLTCSSTKNSLRLLSSVDETTLKTKISSRQGALSMTSRFF